MSAVEAQHEVQTGIDWSMDRWTRVKDVHRRWWAGELDRPLIHMTLHGRTPPRAPAAEPMHHFTSFYDLAVPASEIVDAWDYHLSGQTYRGDAFPTVWPNFGPGVIAAFLGCDLHAHREGNTTWYHPREDREIADLRFEYDPDNVWLNRVKDLCRAAVERWRGLVQVGMTDLGGNLDILSSFRPGENLLLDLYDDPDAVKARTWDAHEMWWRYFDEINRELQPVNPGYTAWTPIFSEEPYYMLQCDFCYMIGPDMFDEFVKPELAACCKKLANPFYHLDGPGQLPHLKSLLEIEELKGVQWIPGAGSADITEWPDVFRAIRDAGKLVQVLPSRDGHGYRALNTIIDQIGDARGLYIGCGAPLAEEDEAMRWLDQYGAG